MCFVGKTEWHHRVCLSTFGAGRVPPPSPPSLTRTLRRGSSLHDDDDLPSLATNEPTKETKFFPLLLQSVDFSVESGPDRFADFHVKEKRKKSAGFCMCVYHTYVYVLLQFTSLGIKN